MSAVIFLLVALTLATTGSVVLWLRSRKPSSLAHSVESFQREMKALAPESAPTIPAQSSWPGRGGRSKSDAKQPPKSPRRG